MTTDLTQTTSALPTTLPTTLQKFADPLRIPRRWHPEPGPQHTPLTVRSRSAAIRLHSQLPPTPLWTYEGDFPGPVIEVRRGRRLRVSWTNGITSPYPVVAAHLDDAAGNPSLAMNDPGVGAATITPGVAALPAWNVVHLHGAVTGGGSDGWTENAALFGESQLSDYLNDQPAMTLWYHDHAMDITRYNVMAGLAGMYLLRDEEEDRLGLPSGDAEVPLVVCDRNFVTDDSGGLTGQLLHKTTGTLPFFGPYTLVNGVIWPHLEVRPRWYRFRVLNASNARVYRLHLLGEDNEQLTGAGYLIGTDSGLLGEPLALPAGGLTLAPAERADILIDFGPLKGRRLRLVNSAQAPFRGDPLPDGVRPGDPLPGARLPEPDVMEFRVADAPADDPFRLPATLSAGFLRLTHDNVPAHEHRMLMLAADKEGTLGLWEMAEVDAGQAPTGPGTVLDGIVQVKDDKGITKTYQRLASRFDDTLNWHVRLDGWEQWKILNVSGILHPIHIHLIRFQALSVEGYDTAAFLPAGGGTAKDAPVAYTGPLDIEPAEQGWKDVIRVPAGTMVSVAGRFGGATGRFMYHCHILEHEDAGMMRPFSVMPGAVMDTDPGMGHGGDPGHEHA
jgi:FtsP/CotA-like multicopper oxidase with cupredoxin domain